jgi:hypothetical protein
MLRPRSALVLLLLAMATDAAAEATPGGPLPGPLPLFPADNWWNLDISLAPVDPKSAAFISFVGPTRALHPDFGGLDPDSAPDGVYGFPYVVVTGAYAQAKQAVQFEYADESDGVDHATGASYPFYPIPEAAKTTNHWIEGGAPGDVDARSDNDRHLLLVDADNKHLYELYNVFFDGTSWQAGSGAFFDLGSNTRRPEGWTSADAAGLAILPGLVRYDEVFGPDEIRHAFRATVRRTNGYVYPASHVAGATAGALPMGARLRLKAGKDISGFAPEVQKIFRAMKTYGLIVADNASDMFVSGTFDTRWDDGSELGDVILPAFRALHASDFEVVKLAIRTVEKPTVQFSAATYSAAEAGRRATITVRRAANLAAAVTVPYTTLDGSAVAGIDYTPASGVLTFLPGVTSRTFTVPVLNDAAHESAPAVLLLLGAPGGGAVLGSPSTAVLTIDDNDPAGLLQFGAASYAVKDTAGNATVSVVRSGGAVGTVTVEFATSDGSAAAPSDYTATSLTLTFGPGVVSRTVAVPVLDSGPDPDETVTLTLSHPTGGASLGPRRTAVLKILSGDPVLQFGATSYVLGERGRTATIGVRRSGPATGLVTVHYSTADGTAKAPGDYLPAAGDLTFGPGVLLRTFKVSVTDDALVEGNETVNLTLDSPTGGAALGPARTAVLTIATDDPSLQFTASSYAASEAAARATIAVKRSPPGPMPVEVSFATAGGTAVDGTNYLSTSGTLSFGPGVASRTFTVPILNDAAHETSETVNLVLTGPTGGAVLGPVSTAVLKITDNDLPGRIQFSAASYSVGESAATVTVTATRAGGKAGGESVDFATADGTADASNYAGASGTLVLGANETSKTFAVTIRDDGPGNASRSVRLSLGNPQGGAVLGSLAGATLWIVGNP